ncbi:MAG: serine hydrolase domain-containing protein [Erythrobacter sp.]|uniref:serine hydrolase domain-containing protein n=1 Tax=Erythrobacter sp. TaxID=1042 RepID=UPI0026389372|nr:serine hydrolase domain-containing protein [Erythrobacter sp.]MDJ0978834.1 serine hydrolase domain-containing protein [Erythrobacter sp.]
MAFRTFDTLGHAPEISRRSLFRGGAYLASAAALSGLPFGRDLLAHDVAEAWPNVAAMAEKYVSEGKVANMFLTFGWDQEDHAHTVGGGTLSLNGSAPVDEDTLYRIYSMSKPITGMAIMMLIDEGKLGLEMPLQEVIPAFRDMQVLVDPEGPLDNTVPAERPITIRQLLTHTAGLGYTIVSKGPLLDAYVENGIVGGRVSRFPIPGVPNPEPAPGLEVWADRLAELPLMYQPASKWSYSCSIDLLGRVIEVVSGMEFEAFLKERLFDPLGMTSTFMTVPESEKGRLADNYGVLNGTVLPLDPASNSIYLDPPKVPSGGGGLVSSPKDYDRFLRMLLGFGKLGEERIMSEQAVRVGTSDLIPASVDKTGSWMEKEGHGAGGRSVGDTFGWGGAAGTLGAIDYKLGLRTALWTQYMPPESYPVREEYLAAIQEDLKVMKKG